MNALNVALTWLAEHGYWFVLAGMVAAFCVRDPVRRRKLVRILLICAGVIVGSIFLAAAYGKLKPLAGFAWSRASIKTSIFFFSMQVESYQILSPAASNFVAHVLPFFELGLGLWLVSGVGLRFSSALAALVFIGFMGAIGYAYYHGLKIDCGCGIGPAEQAGPGTLFRDGVKFLLPTLILLAGSIWIRRSPGSARVPQSAATTAQIPSAQ